jgi:hypothetical protein
VKVGDLVKHNSFNSPDLLGVITSVAPGRIEVLWAYDPGYGIHTPHHPDRLEVIREGG